LRSCARWTAMRFGKKLKDHVAKQKLPKDCYVDYKGLKAAIKSGCSEDVFQELYNAGAHALVPDVPPLPTTSTPAARAGWRAGWCSL
jgi:hypothetical protein